mmetsp:Transcript_7009/g.6192  ORF Transcript_7009/g.6192 Transcript_7009/m.6192 type:complete len:95 (+) Transcript_7009:12-296(+)
MIPNLKNELQKEKKKGSKKLKFKNFSRKKRTIFRGAKMINLKTLQSRRENLMLKMAHKLNFKNHHRSQSSLETINFKAQMQELVKPEIPNFFDK